MQSLSKQQKERSDRGSTHSNISEHLHSLSKQQRECCETLREFSAAVCSDCALVRRGSNESNPNQTALSAVCSSCVEVGRCLCDVACSSILMQIYIGPSRIRVIENQDVVQDLAVGMLVAVRGDSFPRIGKVSAILTGNLSLDSPVEVAWLQQERAPHKP